MNPHFMRRPFFLHSACEYCGTAHAPRKESSALFEEAKVLQPELREVLDQMQAALA